MLSTWLNCCSENALRLLIIGVVVLTQLMQLTQPASAQVPPGAEEISRYTGLHAAAQYGNPGQIGTLVAAGNDIALFGKHQRVIRHGVGFNAQHFGGLTELGQAGAHHLWLATQGIRVLNLATVFM